MSNIIPKKTVISAVIALVLLMSNAVFAETIVITTSDGSYEVEAKKVKTVVKQESHDSNYVNGCLLPEKYERVIVDSGYSLSAAIRKDLGSRYATTCVINHIQRDLAKYPNINIHNVHVGFCVRRGGNGKFDKCPETNIYGALLEY